MYCKKCKYHAFDHLSACPKCGADWEETRKALYLNWLVSNQANWLNPQKSSQPKEIEISPFLISAQPVASAAHAQTAEPAESPVIPMPPQPKATKDAEIEVSLFPELDFSTSTDSPPKAKPAPPAPAGGKKDDLYLDALSTDDIVELDFAPVLDTPPSKSAAPSKPKRDDFFIPELEEMLAPLADDRSGAANVKQAASDPNKPRTAAKPVTTPKFEHENDILLDFGTGPSPSKSSDDEFLSLTLDTKDK